MARANYSMTEEKTQEFFRENELENIEESYSAGLTLAQVIDLFANRGLHLSEATFRKYVQLGLLGRSKRVGRKGKHQGSLGLYPATTIRRINAIRQMMAANYTIEDIQRSFLRFKNEIEHLEQNLLGLVDGFEAQIEEGTFESPYRKILMKDLLSLKKKTTELFVFIRQLERQLVSPLEREARERAFTSGTAMGAEDLL